MNNHAVALRVAGQTRTEHTTLEQKPEALTQWIAELRQRFAGGIVVILSKTRRCSTPSNPTSIFPIPSIRR